MISNKLWDPAKKSLDETIKLDANIPGLQVTIIPFGDNPYEVFSFPASDYSSQQKNIFNAFDKHIKEAKYTHISEVMEKGLNFIDMKKENRLYLLTDGQPNGGDSPEKVAEVIDRWCSTHKNTKFFYVALTKGAIHPKVKKALDNCPDAFTVELDGNAIPQFVDLSPNELYTNLEELTKPRVIDFNLPGKYPVSAISNDSLFNVYIKNSEAAAGKIYIYLSPKNGLTKEDLHQKFQGEEYKFPVRIRMDDSRYYIVNPEVEVNVADEIPSKLTLANGEEEITSDGVKWHDSFLWSKAAQVGEVTWNLNSIFENQLSNSALKMKFRISEGEKEDFYAKYNGKEIQNGSVITIEPDSPAIISVKFNHDAETGKRYFELIPTDHRDLDMINDQPSEDYHGITLRTKYSVGWNPLATFLFWIGIGLLALLILWFLFLQRWFYPRIKMGRVEFTGPNSYYLSKKIKGARKVVMTSKNKKQNILSKIFTGEVKYVKGDHFNPELEILPATGKRKVKITHTKKGESHWDIYPSSIFKQDEKGSLKNRNTKEQTSIFFT